jgi:signal transduction histidine kinase
VPDRLLRNIPIRRKVVLLIMLATGGALLLASAGLILTDRLRFRKEMTRDLQTLAEIIARNSTAAVSFRDPDAASETLTALTAKRSIVKAAIYQDNGNLLAVYQRDKGAAPPPSGPGPDEPVFGGTSLTLFRPITLEGRHIGTVYLESDLSEMAERLRLQVATVTAVFLVSGLAALLFSSGLQLVVSRPILNLARTARAVSEHQDYSIRAVKQSGDELGQLVDAFNQMLEQIQLRDSELLRAKEELERRVEERTLALRQELAERQRAEKELEERNEELHRSNQDLDDFAYIASHDLKEPLRGIHNFAVFLLEDYGDRFEEEGRSKLETLTRLSRRMEILIDSLLHFSRLGRVDLAIDDVDLNEVVVEVLDSLGIHLQENHVAVRMPHPLPVVRCDRVRVRELFYNLILNAIKYNDKAEKWIEIGSTAGALYVRDNGIGIQEKHFDAIFRIFKRLHGRDKFGGGTGAGLTIVKKIVERHNGRIWVESTYGEGTTIYFTLGKEHLVADTQSTDPSR